MTDIFRCKICKTHVLADELDSHVCKNITDVKLDHDKLLVSDGDKWYPLNLKKIISCPDGKQDKKSPDDYTESINVNLI